MDDDLAPSRAARSAASPGRRDGTFLHSQRGFLISWSLVVALLSTGLCYVSPPLYTAEASLLIEPGRNQLLRDEAEHSPSSFEATNDLTKTMLSQPVIEAVVDRLRPHERQSRTSSLRRALEQAMLVLDRWGLATHVEPRQRFILRWQRTLVIDTQGDVVAVGYTNEDPALAANIVNAVVDETIERYIAVLRLKGAAAIRRDMLENLHEQTLAARTAIVDLSGDPAVTESGRADLAGWFGTLRLMREQYQRIAAGLRQRYGPQHPALNAVEEAIRALSASIADTLDRLDAARPASARLQDSQEHLRIVSRQYAAESKLLEILERLETADQRTANLHVVALAAVPAWPVQTRLTSVSIGIFAGLAFACAAAYIRDRLGFRRTVASEVEAVLRAPVVGSVAGLAPLLRSMRAFRRFGLRGRWIRV